MTKAIVALPIIASALIVGIVITLLWMVGSVSGERDRFSSLEIAPKEADVFVAINTDPTSPQWLAVNDSLEAINTKDRLRRLIDEALAEVNLDWEEDILPVAGDEAFFSVPDISEMDEGKGWVAGVRLADADYAKAIFDKMRQKAEDDGVEPLQETEYQGVTIYFEQTPVFNGVPSCDADGECTEPDEKFATGAALAFVEGALAIGSTPGDVESVIDVVQGRAPSAEENQRLQEFRRYQREDFLVWGYADLADVWDLAEKSLPTTLDTTGPNCREIVAGVHACSVKIPLLIPDLTPVSDYVEFAADREVADLSIELPLKEALASDPRTGFFTYSDGGWSRVSEVTLEKGNTVARGQFAELPKNVVVFRDDSEVRLTPAPVQLDPPDTELRVISLDAEYSVAGGHLQVTERIDVDFGSLPKHGIFRDIQKLMDYDFKSDQRIGLTGEIVVLRDGSPEPFEVIPDTVIDTDRIRVGDPNVEITGRHVYEIRYAVARAVRQQAAGFDPYYEIAWNVTGDDWAVPIERASATFTSLEDAITYKTCQAGPDPTNLWTIHNEQNCSYTLSEDSLTGRFETTAPIEPGSGLAFLVDVDGDAGAVDLELVPGDNLSDEDFPFPDPEPEEPEQLAINPLEVAPFDLREVLDELRGTYDRVGFALTSFDEGFAFDVNVVHVPGFEPERRYEPASAYESTFAGLVPADTMFFLSYFDVYDQSWLPAKERLDDFELEDGSRPEDFLEEFANETGVDLEKDILALLTGEVAFAGDVDFSEETPDVQVIGLADVNDQNQAQDTVKAIEDYLERKGVIAGNRDADVHVWEILDVAAAKEIGVVVRDGRVIVGYSADAVSDAGADETLADTHDWQRTMELLPDEKTFVGFVSIARLTEELEKRGYEDTFGESMRGEMSLADLEAIRSVGFSGTSRDNGFGMHFVLFMEDR